MEPRRQKPRSSRALSPKTQLFIAEYLKDFNGAQAAIRAGFSPRSARIRASEMLRNVTVAEAVRADLERVLQSSEISVARVLRQLAVVAFFDPARMFDESGHLLPIEKMPPEVRHGIPAIEVVESRGPGEQTAIIQRFRLSKLAAILALAKHVDLFTKKINHERNMLDDCAKFAAVDDDDIDDFDDIDDLDDADEAIASDEDEDAADR